MTGCLQPGPRPVRVVIEDEHTVFLDALSAVLSRHGMAVTVARTVAEAVDAAACQRPDVCVIGQGPGRDGGQAAIRGVAAASPGTKVLVLAADPGSEGAARALSAGASGYLHKACGLPDLIAAIGRVLRGEEVVDLPASPRPSRPVVQHDIRRLAGHLTDRERECLRLVVEGLDTAHIAARLGIAHATARTHVQSLLTKLGVHSRLEAVCLAVRYRLLDDNAYAFPASEEPEIGSARPHGRSGAAARYGGNAGRALAG